MRLKAFFPVWIKQPIKNFLTRRGYLDIRSDLRVVVLTKPYGTYSVGTVHTGRRRIVVVGRLNFVGPPRGDSIDRG